MLLVVFLLRIIMFHARGFFKSRFAPVLVCLAMAPAAALSASSAAAAAPPLGLRSTAKDVLDATGADLRGKVAVVTGGNSGIGLETVKALVAANCKVILACRSPADGEAALARALRGDDEAAGARPRRRAAARPRRSRLSRRLLSRRRAR